MATITEMQQAINELINSDGKVEIPGLEFESVINNLVDVRYKEVLDKATDPEQRQQLKENLLNYYRNDGRMIIDESINTIKSCYSEATEGLKQVSEAAAKAVANNAIPSVITVGTATSTANPAYALIENANKKATLLSMLKSIGDALVRLLSAAIKIAFQVPDMIMTVIQTLTTTKQVVNSIPV